MADAKPESLKQIEKQSQSTDQSVAPSISTPPPPLDTPVSPKKGKLSLPKLKLPRIGKKKVSASPVINQTADKVEPVTPEEIVNTIDKDVQVISQSVEEKLGQEMSEQISQVKADYVEIKVTRKAFVVSTAVVVILIWLSLALQYRQDLLNAIKSIRPADKVEEQSPVSEENPSAQTQEATSASSIKIKTLNPNHQEVLDLQTQLMAIYPSVTIEQAEITEELITILTQNQFQNEYDRVISFLTNRDMATRSAIVLSDDSDVNILVLYPVPENK